MRLGVILNGNLPSQGTNRWFTHSWPEAWRVLWMVVPTAPVQNSAPQLEWKVQVERQTPEFIKYFFEVKNLSAAPVNFEVRYAIMN